MGELTFDAFATRVREHLWVLQTEPAFRLDGQFARFMWLANIAELQPLTPTSLRLSLSSHGELIRTVELPMTEEAVRLAADGIIAVFEPDEP
jgi:hypothetical protein